MILNLHGCKCQNCGDILFVEQMDNVWLYRFPDGRIALPFCDADCTHEWVDKITKEVARRMRTIN